MAMSIDKLYFSNARLCLFLSFMLIITEAAPEAALITQLPGFNGTFPSKHYSGYVTIGNDESKKFLFYYFVVSERNPVEDPVVLWLNGGPGCSSFDGYVYEHGPFNFEAVTPGAMPKLHLNPYSWSKVSNIIYLDSPAGVGFSYSQNKSNYVTGDLQTASDTHTFLLKWLQQFPEFQPNPFYVSGESYAGIYVPTLVSEIVKGVEGGVNPIINIKGYLVGNGVADDVFDGNALVPFAHGMALISDDMFQEAEATCKGNYSDYTSNTPCSFALVKIENVLDDLNIYDILEPCYHGDSNGKNTTLPLSFKQLGTANERPLAVRKRMFGRAWPYRAPVKGGIVPLWPELESKFVNSIPCVNDEVATIWLNHVDVRNAIHAASESFSGPWAICSSMITYNHDTGSMIDYHKSLTTRGYRALIYSGDHDMCVPYTGSEAWTRSLGYKVVDEWRPWFVNNQVSGYTQGYANNLTFLTVKGAGHTVPEYKPREALAFYSKWLDGETI